VDEEVKDLGFIILNQIDKIRNLERRIRIIMRFN